MYFHWSTKSWTSSIRVISSLSKDSKAELITRIDDGSLVYRDVQDFALQWKYKYVQIQVFTYSELRPLL